MTQSIRATIWNEFRHEKSKPVVAELYPKGIHGAIADGLAARIPEDGLAIRTATLDEPEHGLTQTVLDQTDVLLWWGHMSHHEVAEEVVDRVQRRVLDGMGLVVLHSGHHAKVFRRLMGTSCDLVWREADAGERERLWTVDPGHPIAEGIGPYIELPATEMYGEPFDIPEPDALVFISWFEGGEVFRSGCCYRRGRGRIFYFRPGHETFPIYRDDQVLRVLANAVRWAAPAHADGAKPSVINRRIPLEAGAPAQTRNQ